MINYYKELVGFIGNALPDIYEVFLFDTTKKGYPVVEQSNWISRSEKETRKLLIDTLKNETYVSQGCAINLLNVVKDSIFKTSIYFVKDNGSVVGALCINTDCAVLMKAEALLSGVLTISNSDMSEPAEIKAVDVEARAVGLDDIKKIVENFGVEPERMTALERKEVFLDLYDSGVFRFKGAVPRVAEELRMSEQSVYRYLSNIKKKRI